MASRNGSAAPAKGKPKPGSAAGKGKKKGGAADAAPADELDAMSVEQLAEELKKQQQRLTEVRRNRNYYQLEKDQVAQHYEVVQSEVSKTESHLRNIESQMERMSDTHRNDIRIYLQKVIHLEYEHNNNVESIGALASADQEAAAKQHESNKSDLKELKLSLAQELQRAEVNHEEEIRRLKEVERKEMQKLREAFERGYQELLHSYETRLEQLKADLELRQAMEQHEIEERKNRHINDLMIHHEKNFQEMRSYYNAITQDNLDLIKELNNEIEDLKIAHLQNEKAMEQIEKKNASLSEPLAQAESRVKALQHKLANYSKDKQSLKHARNRLSAMEDRYKSLQDQLASQRALYAQIDADRMRLYTTFEETVLQVQRVGASKNAALEQMLAEYTDAFDVKKAQFTSVLKASNLDPMVLASVTAKLDEVLSAKNEQIEELKYETAKLTKAHNDLVRTFQAKLKAMGVPEDQVALEEIVRDPQGRGMGTAPADLIVQ